MLPRLAVPALSSFGLALATIGPGAHAQTTPSQTAHSAHPAAHQAPHPAHAVHHVQPAAHGTRHHVTAAHKPAGHAKPGHPAHPAPAPAPVKPAPLPAPPPPPPPPSDKGTVTGLPLPRFAALRAEEVNLRSGPGTRYPIQWVYHRRDLPVRIEREFDVWRLIEDMDGVKGWVNQATLVGSRGFVVTVPLALLRDAPNADGTLVAVLREGVVGRLLRCDAPAAGAAPEPLAGPAGMLATAADSAPVGPPEPAASAVDPNARPAGAQPAPPAPPEVTRSDQADPAVAQAVAQARAGVTHSPPADAQAGWCRARVKDYTGWLPRDALYGLEAGEVIAPS